MLTVGLFYFSLCACTSSACMPTTRCQPHTVLDPLLPVQYLYCQCNLLYCHCNLFTHMFTECEPAAYRLLCFFKSWSPSYC